MKHYHVKRYVASELNLSQSVVIYFLLAVVDVLHCCVYPELILFSSGLANNRTPYKPEGHHELLVDSTFIAILQPDDLDQCETMLLCKQFNKWYI